MNTSARLPECGIIDVNSWRVIMRIPVSDRFWKQVNRTGSCWLWLGPKNNHGYGRTRYSGKKWNAHRVAWVFSVGLIPDGMHVLHHCDNPACVNPKHLWLGTHQDNIDDRERKGRNRPPLGERQSRHALTNADVIAIRKLHKDGRGLTLLANFYGVSRTTIWKVVTRRTWDHL